MKSDFTGFVLAGGKSSRMGTDKFALQIGGETFLTRAVDALSGICEKVVIVLNHSQTIETNFPIVRDIFSERGANGGIHAALANCETEFAVVLAVDLPLVDRQAIEQLARVALVSPEFSAIVPTQKGGKPQPLCAVYRVKDCRAALEKLLDENKKASVRDFLDIISAEFVAGESVSLNENFLFNVNFPADYQKIA
jgi:molybdopterin-guanine dinucleotide biosynthesis protein A